MSSRIDFENALNGEQLAAVTAPDGAALVIAAAGTGKTRTLVYRVAYLVEKGVDPQRILLLTFTNKAAREMLERARDLVGSSVSGLWGGTFHHMANRLLRRHAEALGYQSDYTILDQDDARSLVKQCIDQFGLKTKHFPKPDVLLSLFGLADSIERPVEGLAQERFEHTPVEVSDILRVHRKYQSRKRELNSMDFDDLLVNGLKLFRDHPDLLARYRERFQHTLVDEYQDTNPIQAEWVDMISGADGNIMAVGDDFQSIYSWRGADFKNILTFPKRYPAARVYKLETNYRSVPEILNVANACIAGNPEQFQKVLRPVREAYRKPTVLAMRDGREQARAVIEQIRALRAEGYKMSDMAILYRAHFQSLEIQLELTDQRMPYVITSGVRFFEQAHIKDVCALVRLFTNASDELAFWRLLGMWPRVGQKTAAGVWKKLGGRCDLRKEATRKQFAGFLPPAAREAWAAIEPICASYETDDLASDPGEIIHRFVKSFYDLYARETFDNYERRIEDIEELINYTTNFETAEAFVADIALQTNLDAEDEQIAVPQEEYIRLSTIHQAKGLEWKVVFILWLADGLFPSARSMAESAGESEERRLFYVAVTRAKDDLYMCVPRLRQTKDGGLTYYSPSRFLREIPPELVRKRELCLY